MMKFKNEPTSCNDLIITLILSFVLITSAFIWLYSKGTALEKTNQELIAENLGLEKDHALNLQVIDKFDATKQQLKNLKTKQSEKINQLTQSLQNFEITNKQLNETLAQKNKEHLESVEQLKSEINQHLQNIDQVKQQSFDVENDLKESNQNLHETRILSEQQFNEYKQLKRDLVQSQFNANERLKEIQAWRIEVDKLRQQLTDTDIQINQLKHQFTVFELNHKILFDKGKTELNAQGKKTLSTLAAILLQYPKRQIAIQGHSDNQPLGQRLKQKYLSNWELAAARAASAIYYLQYTKSINPERIILVSYGHYRPKNDDDTTEGLAENRRIEVMLMPEDFDFMRETNPDNL